MIKVRLLSGVVPGQFLKSKKMIEANDLRRGNKFLGIAGVQTVKSIIDHTDRGDYMGGEAQRGYEALILVNENRNQYKPCEIDGIPLTEDILIKAGFEKRTHDDAFWYEMGDENSFTFYTSDLPKTKGQVVVDYKGHKIRFVKTLHELQNIYYVLFETELNFKL